MPYKQKWRNIAVYAPGVIALLFGASVLDLQRRGAERAHALIEVRDATRTLLLVLSDLKDVEVGRRGYTITGDTAFLQPYNEALPQIHARQLLLHDMPASRHLDLEKFDHLIARKLSLSAGFGRTDSTAVGRATTEGKIVMDSIRAFVADAVDEETRVESGLRAIADEHHLLLVWMIIAGSVIVAGATFATTRAQHRFLNHIEASAAELETSNVQLSEQAVELELQSAEMEANAATLQASEERYRRLAENAPDVIYRYRPGPEPVLEYINSAVERITGHSPESVYAEPARLFEDVHPDDRRIVDALAIGQLPENHIANIRWVREGKVMHTQHYLSEVRDDEGTLVAVEGIARDITDQYNFDAAVKLREQRFRALIENSSDIVVVIEHGRVTYVSDNIHRMLGYTAEDVLGSTGMGLVHPDDLMIVEAGLSGLRESGATSAWNVRTRNSAGEWRELSVTGRNIPATEGVGGIVLNVRDITEQRELEDQLRQSQKMEAIGRLAGGISHDFNNLLTAIKGATHFALESIDAVHPARADIEEIARAADRAEALTRQLLAFSRKQPIRQRAVDLGDLVRGMEKMLCRVVGEDVRFVASTEPGLPPLLADPSQLEQVILNLVINSRDALPSGGEIAIDVRREKLVPRQGGAAAATFVALSVRDNGSGMDAATRSRIFEPFFTTKESGKGTGLGLSTVYGIVSQSGGTIQVQSEPGRGTTFRVLLPAADPAALPRAPERAAPESPQVERGGSVLLVEDDRAVRIVATRILESAGYTVTATERPADAVEIARDEKPFDVLVTDVVMPEMTGRELSEQILMLHPDLPVIFMSGYTEEEILSRGVASGVQSFVDKPFAPRTLIQAVADALGARSRAQPGDVRHHGT